MTSGIRFRPLISRGHHAKSPVGVKKFVHLQIIRKLLERKGRKLPGRSSSAIAYRNKVPGSQPMKLTDLYELLSFTSSKPAKDPEHA